MEVAVRESVINAIKHGNRHDRAKYVTVEFTTRPAPAPERTGHRRSGTRARGSIPRRLPIPLAPENLLKSSGRGIFFMRSFMDDVQLSRLPEGGMEVRMVKRLAAGLLTARQRLMAHDPRFLATAIDIVLRAGEIQLAHFQRDVTDRQEGRDRPRDRGRPRSRADVPARARRAVPVARDPRRGARRPSRRRAPTAGHCWIFDPIDGTTNYAHGLPIFCAALGLEIDGRVEVAAIYDPTRRELFTAERGGGAYLNGARMQRVRRGAPASTPCWSRGSRTTCTRTPTRSSGCSARSSGARGPCGGSGSAALDMAYVAAGRFDGFWEDRLKPWDVAAASLLVEEAGGVVSGHRRHRPSVVAERDTCWPRRRRLHGPMLETIRDFRDGRSRNRTS